jgi:hypothetical protein
MTYTPDVDLSAEGDNTVRELKADVVLGPGGAHEKDLDQTLDCEETLSTNSWLPSME